MVYRLRWKKGNKNLESVKTFKNKSDAEKKAKFFRQMDDDLPRASRDKSLKTYRVVKVPETKKVIKSKTTPRKKQGLYTGGSLFFGR